MNILAESSDLPFSSATQVAAAIRGGGITSLRLTECILERIDRLNPALNAIVTLTRDKALATAKEADKALSRGVLWGPLHGVPLTIKDCFEVAGVRTTAGSPSLSNHMPDGDAASVARLRDAGAVLLGKTNVPIMAGDWQTYNKVFGTTSNPWDLERTPGGSTGGGAAALAAGYTYLSLGSDIGGSIRVPSHFCGLYGHKTTLNVIPYRGHIPKSVYHPPLLTVAGTLARRPDDLKLALEVLGGPDDEEAKAYSWTLPPARGGELSDYRLGYVVDHSACPLTAEVADLVQGAVEKLEDNVATIEEGWPEGVDPVKQWTTYRFLLGSVYASFLKDDGLEEKRLEAEEQNGGYEAIVAKAWTAPHKHFQFAHAERMHAMAAWRGFFEDHDAMVMPVAFTPAFPHDHSQPFWSRRIPTPSGPRAYEDLYFWVSFATLSGLPATVAPIGRTPTGLPVGIQIIGPYMEDATPID
ncbi:MAG: amidase, partial [Candidatus Bathyarchaeota archaeon]